MADYLILFLIVFGIHLTPAFTPPTSPVIVIYSLAMGMPLWLLVVSAALAAALGRYALAHVTRLLRHRLGGTARRNLEAAHNAVATRRRSKFLIFGAFILSPISSALLFEAAGLAGIRLGLPTLAYFVNRIAFYSAYAITARTIAPKHLGDVLYERATSPLGIAVQIGLLVLLATGVLFDWSKWLARRSSKRGSDSDG